MATAKTKKTETSVASFVAEIKDAQRRADCEAIADMMKAATKDEGKMWGSAIAGYGTAMVQYAGGKQQEWMSIGFSPRAAAITLYLGEVVTTETDLLAKLGTHSCGKGCLYVKRLADVDKPTLKKLIAAAVKHKAAR